MVSDHPPISTINRSSSCRICSIIAGQHFAANGFDWFRCRACGTTQKVLTQQEYQDLNPTYDPGLYLDDKDKDERERYLAVDEAVAVLSAAVSRRANGSTNGEGRPLFLDVGCGMGRYLIAAQRLGYQVLGFEPSLDHARVATQHFNLPVINDYFSPHKVGEKRFDLIMLSHVIEHIYDPRGFIQHLTRVLKPGGILIIITPNNDSLLARTLGKFWPMLKPVDHVSLIGARAYKHFGLEGVATVHHSTSEYPLEFVASVLSALKSSIVSAKAPGSTHVGETNAPKPSPLRNLGAKAKLLRYALTVASAPMYLAAIITGRQACLTSIIVRNEHAVW